MTDENVLDVVDSYVPNTLRVCALGGEAADMVMFSPHELMQFARDVEAAILRAYELGRLPVPR